MTVDEARDLILSFPGVSEEPAYGKPAFKVAGKFFTRIRCEDASLVLSGVSFDERRCTWPPSRAPSTSPPPPAVLARIASVDPGAVGVLLERRWRKIAPKALTRAPE